jgi:hypothetical protein
MASDGTFKAKSSSSVPYFGGRDTMTDAAAEPAQTDLAAEKAEARAAVARVAATDTSTGEANAIRVAAGQRQIGG